MPEAGDHLLVVAPPDRAAASDSVLAQDGVRRIPLRIVEHGLLVDAADPAPTPNGGPTEEV